MEGLKVGLMSHLGQTRTSREITETALAHVIGDKAEQAYRAMHWRSAAS